MTVHEMATARARAVKVEGLTKHIDRLSVLRGSPIRAVEILKWNETNWLQAALDAGITDPSPTTRSAFIERIAERDAAVLAANSERAVRS